MMTAPMVRKIEIDYDLVLDGQIILNSLLKSSIFPIQCFVLYGEIEARIYFNDLWG